MPMWSRGDDQDPEPLGPGEVMRMLAPSFAASVIACVVGFILLIDGHRTAGVIILLLGAGIGSLVRLRLMMRGRRR
jgi:hypothetical protein